MKRTLKLMVRSALVCFFCITMLTSSTYAYLVERTVSKESQASSPRVELYWTDQYNTNYSSWHNTLHKYDDNQQTSRLFDVGNKWWEPGYAEVRYIRFELLDSVTGMTFEIDVNRDDFEDIDDPNLAQVIDVYFFPNASSPITRADIVESKRVCTLAELVDNINSEGERVYIRGSFTADSPANVALVLKMRESADNYYQDNEYNFNLTFDVSQGQTNVT